MHYRMIDYFIDLLYKNDESLRTIIDAISITNEHMRVLRKISINNIMYLSGKSGYQIPAFLN